MYHVLSFAITKMETQTKEKKCKTQYAYLTMSRITTLEINGK
jgi:hypothetical protein